MYPSRIAFPLRADRNGRTVSHAGHASFGHLAGPMSHSDDEGVSVAEPESLISREEVVAMLFNIADIAEEARIIRQLLEENGETEEDQ
jgi:hypothetical protein